MANGHARETQKPYGYSRIMAYARFGWGSDVYVFAHVHGGYCCCACSMNSTSIMFQTAQETLKHLSEHVSRSESVPQSAIEELGLEAACEKLNGPYSLDELNAAIESLREIRRQRKELMDSLDALLQGLSNERTNADGRGSSKNDGGDW